MRAAALTAMIASFGLATIPVPGWAAPAAPALPNVSAASPDVMLVRGGCGRGWHRQVWRDRYGRRHIRCAPNR